MSNRYFDNAATSFPKPQSVAQNISHYLTQVGGTYGRGAYSRIVEASKAIETVRELLASFLETKKTEHIVFTNNATHAINTVLFGLSLQDRHILISPIEHNAVMRPLYELTKRSGVTFDILPHGNDGLVDIEKLIDKIQKNTSLVIINHQSNVNGVIQPIEQIKRAVGDIPILIDASQSFGHTPISIDNWDLDFVAFTGHKGLLGPSGTGGLFIKNPAILRTFVFGGTGSKSESYEMPPFLPDKYEAGTPNIVGLYGLLGALENRPKPLHSKQQFKDLLDNIKKLDQWETYCANDFNNQGDLFSLNHKSIQCSDIASRLFSEFSIETRSGLHCAPLAHQTIGTYPNGTIRIAPSAYHTIDDFTYLFNAISSM